MITEYNSKNPVVIGDKPVLLDFYATWCGPCNLTAEHLKNFSEKYPDITIYKINVEDNDDITKKYNIMSLPTLIYENSDGILWRHIGLMTSKMLEEKLK